MTPRRRKRHVVSEYTIACICPLGVELAPVEGMLDEIHEPIAVGRGQNAYTFGRLGAHNVVVAVMPETGNSASAAVATQLRNDFPSVRFGLLVGIGGGVPGDVDVRLGDVVVSKATSMHGGVIQYDLGKRLQGGTFERTGMLNKPPAVLSASVQRLQAQHVREGNQIQKHMTDLARKYPRLQTQCARPATVQDDLFNITYEHRNGPTCNECSRLEVVERPTRPSDEPYVHYGTIGSANVVLRDAVIRDELRKDMNILCVEMEAAGLLNDFPCIVIRGICDYADSHKNKQWQSYAAAVAAAYMKDLLLAIPSNAVEPSLRPSTASSLGKRARRDEDRAVQDTEIHDVDSDILASLAFPQMRDRQLNVAEPHANSCRWILNLPEYRAWCNQSCGLLWIKGKPGAGKSTMMSFLHTQFKEERVSGADISLEFFFSARGAELQKTFVGMLRSLLNQVFQQSSEARSSVRNYYIGKCAAFGQRKASWDWQQRELETLLRDSVLAAAQRRTVRVFVDALDESGVVAARTIAQYFHTINDRVSATTATAKFCISCRHFPIVSTYRGVEICIEEHNSTDIGAYVAARLGRLDPLLLQDHDAGSVFWNSIQAELVQRAAGVFQWISLVMPIVEDCVMNGLSFEEIRSQIQQVPELIGDVYEHIIRSVLNRQTLLQTFYLFQWICLAERPLLLTEMRYALASNNATPQSGRSRGVRSCDVPSFVKSDEVMKQRVKILSGGLAEVVNKYVQVGHQTVKEYLMQDGLALLASLCMSPRDGLPAVSSGRSSSEISVQVIRKCQASLYQSCLAYLATEMAMFRIEDLGHVSGWRNTLASIEILRKSPFLPYAAENVFLHAKEAGHCREQSMVEDVELVEMVRLFWIAVCVTLNGRHRGSLGMSYLACPEHGASTLHIAAGAGLVDLVDHLLLLSTTVDQMDAGGNTALHVAVRERKSGVMEILFNAGFSITTKTEKGETPLSLAAATGQLDLVKWLLEQAARGKSDVSTNEELALLAACTEGYSDVVWLLLEAGIDPNSQNEEECTALQAACHGSHEEVVRLLLDRGADVSIEGGTYGSALQAASYRGNELIVQWLLSRSADVNIGCGRFESALQAACYGGHFQTVRMLLAAGADVNTQGGEFGTALQAAAVTKSNKDIVLLLLANGAAVDTVGGWYGTALQAASRMGELLIVCILLDHGANVNIKVGSYVTALTAACVGSYEEVVRLLLDRGAEVNVLGGAYGSALSAASSQGAINIVDVLLTKGAVITATAPGSRYYNALQAASHAGHEEVVLKLLRAGAQINAHGGTLHSAIQAAASMGRADVAQILVNMGADVNARGGLFGTAIFAAAGQGYHEVVDILIAAGAEVNVEGLSYRKACAIAKAQPPHESLQHLDRLDHRGYHKVLRSLLAAGAHIDASDFFHTFEDLDE